MTSNIEGTALGMTPARETTLRLQAKPSSSLAELPYSHSHSTTTRNLSTIPNYLHPRVSTAICTLLSITYAVIAEGTIRSPLNVPSNSTLSSSQFLDLDLDFDFILKQHTTEPNHTKSIFIWRWGVFRNHNQETNLRKIWQLRHKISLIRRVIHIRRRPLMVDNKVHRSPATPLSHDHRSLLRVTTHPSGRVINSTSTV